MTDIRRLSCATALALGVLLSPFAASAQEKIKLGLLPFSESLAAVIADKQGFFKDEGLEVEITKFDSGAIAVPVLQSGRLDIVLSNTVSTFQAIEQGLDAVVLAPGAIVRDVAAGYHDRADRAQGLDQVAQGSRRQARRGQRDQQHGVAACGRRCSTSTASTAPRCASPKCRSRR